MNDDLATFHLGDCVEVMATMDAESVDAVVTDPPYQLSFMGKEWDRKHDHEPWSREAYRLLKPGGYLLAFGGTRTYHRLASAIEDAGFEIRDCLVWAYASGFPKSLDVSKAMDKAAGADREVVGRAAGAGNGSVVGLGSEGSMGTEYDVTAPATDAAKRWQGWGTALKPAWEPIVMARKPLIGTVAANVAAYGTGALNIDGTRIGFEHDSADPATNPAYRTAGGYRQRQGTESALFGNGALDGEHPAHALGRWPANVILTDPLFDGGVDGVVGGGTVKAGIAVNRNKPDEPYISGEPTGWALPTSRSDDFGYGDTGTYSRFFLIPKAARSDREPVLRGQLAEGENVGVRYTTMAGDGRENPAVKPVTRENLHPTVKPVELMRHLVRLVTPPGGTVLDCFLGSGTTAIAANMEGFRCIGIEREAEYLEIARARMAHQKIGMGL